MNLTKTKKPERKFAFIILLLSLLLALLPAAGNATFAQAQGARKQVLFINSYHIGFKFSDEILSAITAVFKEQGNINLRIEYLDTKRISNPEYLEQVYQLFKLKYKDAKLDLVMSSDDAALNFLFKNADTLFPDVPVVFVGANFFDVTRLKGHERFTGISEEADIAGTLGIALNLHPKTNRVVVVNDTTVTGQIIHQTFTELMPQYPQITFEFLEDVTMDEIRQRLGTLAQDSLVLLTIFSKDKAGTFFEYDQFSSLVAESSSVPVYGTWDFSLGYGIVGGKLTSGSVEGERVAKLALRILAGEKPGDIPVDKQVKSRYMFDYKVLDKWGIDISRLPEGSVILDRPVSFYEENRGAIWGVLIGFSILIFIIALLAINNNQRRRAQAELEVSNRELQAIQVSLEQRVADRTKALATSTEVSRRLSTILDQETLVQEVVEQLQLAFNYYHAHIYLLDATSGDLVMAGGTGEAGHALLAKGHRVPKGKGLVGRAAETKEAILVSDTSSDPDWVPNPLLPETKSEIAVPILTGEHVLGVLDVQNNVVASLGQQDADLISSIASQVAVALQNSSLYAAAEAERNLIRTLIDTLPDQVFFKDTQGRVILNNVADAHAMGVASPDEAVGKSVFDTYPPEFASLYDADDRAVIESGQPFFNREEPSRDEAGQPRWTLTTKVPITDSQGKRVGLIGIARDITRRKRDEEALDKRAKQQETLNLITQKIQSTTSVEAALQMAARELGHALGMRSTLVTLDPEALAGEHKGNTND